MSETEFKAGDGVVYRPYPGAPAEDGVVTGLSNDPSLVFVRYASQHPGAPGQATPRVRLERAAPSPAGDSGGERGCVCDEPEKRAARHPFVVNPACPAHAGGERG